jgi:membrane protease YdiL (CAAX protease family)
MSEVAPPAIPPVGVGLDGPPLLRVAPELREMALIGGLAFFLHLSAGTILQWLNFRWGLFASQVLFIATPAFLAARLFYLDPRATLRLERPRGAALAGAIVGVAGLNWILTIAAEWQERIFPTPEPLREFFEDLLVYRGRVDFAMLILVLAIVPGICEEILFRGFMQSGLVRALGGARRGVVAGALLFAAFHLDPWRFAGVFVLGLFLGYAVVRSGSIWPAVAGHALNNALSIGVAAFSDADTAPRAGVPGGVAGAVAAVAALGIGSWFLARSGPAGPRGHRPGRVL